MVDLHTQWLGLTLRSPLVIGASPLADDIGTLVKLTDAGAGAVVLRSVFEEQLSVEQLAAHRFFDSYTDTNAEARTFMPETEVFALGAEPALTHLRAIRSAVAVPVIASLNGVTPGGWTSIAGQMAEAGADAIELNLYDLATSIHESGAEVEARQIEVVRSVVAAVNVPVSVKLTPFYSSVTNFVTRIADAGAAGVVLFNRFYQPDIDLDALDVDRRLVLSTSAELPLRLHALALLHGRVDLSLASSGGVHSGHDAAKAILSGASAVQMVSSLLPAPITEFTRILRELTEWLDEKGYLDIGEACGAMALDNVGDPHAWGRMNYSRILQGWRPDRR